MAEPVDQSIDEIDAPDVSMIDTPINQPLEQEADDTAEQATDEGADDEQESEQQEETTEGEQQPAEEQAAETDTEAIKQHNAEMARQRIANRQRTKQEIAQQLDQTYGPKTEDQLIEEGVDPQTAQIQALREEMAYKERRAEIAEMNASMQSDAVNVFNDFPVFNPSSKEFDPEFAKLVEQQYRTAARVQFDETNPALVLNAEVPLYDFYQQMATIYNRGAAKGSQQGQQSAIKTLSRTENPGGSSSTRADDSLEALEERLGDVSLI